MIRVLIVDDHAMVREGLRKLLTEAADIEVVGLCSDGQQALTRSAAVRPDVVLMDIQMPVMSGIDATSRLLAQQPSVKVLMLSAAGGARVLVDAARAGAKGYVSKNGDSVALVTAVRAVAAGDAVWPATGGSPGQ